MTGSRLLEILKAEAPRPELDFSSPETLLALLSEQVKVFLRPGECIADWLLRFDRQLDSERREHLRTGVAEFLGSGVLLGPENRDAFLHALDFVEKARITEAVDPLQRLVKSRSLIGQITESYSDLHGRALKALNTLGELDPVTTLVTELPFREYAPLAFAFLRDREKDKIARFLPQIALTDFFDDALRTVRFAYPEESFAILREGANRAMVEGNPLVVASFLAALPRLDLPPNEESELKELLTGRPEAVPDIFVYDVDHDAAPWEALRLQFAATKVPLRTLSSPEDLRTSHSPLVLVRGGTRPENALWNEMGGAQWVEIFEAGDSRPSQGRLSIALPCAFAQEEAADHIQEKVLGLWRKLSAGSPENDKGAKGFVKSDQGSLRGRYPQGPQEAIAALNRSFR